jgi:VWFA-related protein
MKLAKLLLPLFAVALVASAQAPRTLALLFDLNSLNPADLTRAQDSAVKFVQQQMAATDKMAIITSGDKPSVLQDFTGDRDALIAALHRIMPLGTAGAQTNLKGLQDVAAMLQPVEGKKAVMYFSAGLSRSDSDQGQLQAAINAAIRANVSLYPIDTRELQ